MGDLDSPLIHFMHVISVMKIFFILSPQTLVEGGRRRIRAKRVNSRKKLTTQNMWAPDKRVSPSPQLLPQAYI
jgi:hypothetical protein